MPDVGSIDPVALERYRDLLLMLARTQLGLKYRAKVEPEGVVNQTIFDAYQQRSHFRGSTDAELVAWLKTMLSNNVMDAIRFQHRDKRDIDRERCLAATNSGSGCGPLLQITCGLTSPSMKLVKHEQELQLARALSRLPDNQRSAVELHHLCGASLAETAEILHCTRAAVVGLLRRGLKRLREILQDPTTSH